MKKSSIHRQIRAIGPALLLGCASVTALAQDLGHKSPPQSKPVIIHNATIHPVSGPAIDGGFVAFDAGKITAVGKPDSAFDLGKRKSDGWLIIDAAGKHVYPGLIAAYTQLGLTEVAAARATLDMSEVGQATPEVRASVAVNPDSTLIPVARTNGVLIAGVFPSAALTGQNAALDGPGGIVPGRAGVMLLDGWTTEQMAADPQAGIIVNWPSMRPVTAWWMNLSKQEQRKDSETTLAIIDKRRKTSKDTEAKAIIGDVAGKNVIMVDDMITTAGTMTEAVKILKANGAADVYLCATHAVFAPPAMERLAGCAFTKIAVTDSIPIGNRCDAIKDRLEVLGVAGLLGDAIQRIHLNESVSALFQKDNGSSGVKD